MGEPHIHQWKYSHRDPTEDNLLVYRCHCGLRTTEVSSLPAPERKQQTLEEFLAMRLRDIEVSFEGLRFGGDIDKEVQRRDSLRFLIYSLQFVLEQHSKWPVMVETKPEITPISPSDEIRPSLNRYAMQMSQQIAWFTRNQYVIAFGTEAPTSPILKMMALQFQHHPHFNPNWVDDVFIKEHFV